VCADEFVAHLVNVARPHVAVHGDFAREHALLEVPLDVTDDFIGVLGAAVAAAVYLCAWAASQQVARLTKAVENGLTAHDVILSVTRWSWYASISFWQAA
jgi:hypothetical protein